MNRTLAACFLIFVTVAASISHAALTESEQKRVFRLKGYIDKGAEFYKQKQFAKSAEELMRAHKLLKLLISTGDAELLAAIKPSRQRLEKAGVLLSKRGHKLPDLKALSESSQVSDEVSFTKHVAPIFVTRCASCHVRESKGELSMATYAALLKGSENGPVISDTADESTLITAVVSGDMPPRGGPIPAEEIETLKNWVQQGAKFDGSEDDKTAAITSFVSDALRRQPPGPPEASPSTGEARPARPQRPPFES